MTSRGKLSALIATAILVMAALIVIDVGLAS